MASLYSAFANDFLREHPALQSVLVTGDEASGLVRGVGVYAERRDAEAVNSDPEFAAFNDAVAPLLSAPPERIELELLHSYTR